MARLAISFDPSDNPLSMSLSGWLAPSLSLQNLVDQKPANDL
jgi:hypothetical protein